MTKIYSLEELKQKLNNCIELFKSFLTKKRVVTEWKNVISVLNELNKSIFIDEWLYKYCEILPNSILDEKNFLQNKKNWEHINYNEFCDLNKLYSNSVEIEEINILMELIHEIASIEVYTDSLDISLISFEPYSKFIKIINCNI
jgi:hypothetical protein